MRTGALTVAPHTGTVVPSLLSFVEDFAIEKKVAIKDSLVGIYTGRQLVTTSSIEGVPIVIKCNRLDPYQQPTQQFPT